MIRTPGGPAIVLALVLAEISVGGIAVLWLTPTWGHVRVAFFKLLGGVLAVFAVLAWMAARAPLLAGPAPTTGARVEVGLLGAFAALAVLWQALLWARALRASRVIGIASVPVGVAALIAIGADPAASSVPAAAAFQLLAGAAFAGAVTDGLLLGHWYLVERNLSREPLRRMNHIFLIGCVLAGIGAVIGGTGGGEARADLSPLLGVGVLTVSLAVGLVAVCGLIGFFIAKLVKENSIQAATGFFYLAVIMAVAAEFAAKVRFF